MITAWEVAQVRAAEHALMDTLPAGELMQRAAAGLARRCALLLTDRFGRVYGRRVVLLVGSGDNGGDALYAGARLARRGAAVTAVALRPQQLHAGGAAALRAAGGVLRPAAPEQGDGYPAGPVDLVMDGIVGIGATGGLRPDAAALVARLPWLRAVDGRPPVTVAVDVPSGVEVDTGAVPGDAVGADVTVTFGCYKPALVAGPAAPLAGLVELVDIGLGPYLTGEPAARVPEAADVAAAWRWPSPEASKYSRGVVGVATGSARYPGAGLLSVAGALAGPAGMVRYAGSAYRDVVAAYPPVLGAATVAGAGRVRAWACGSGLGRDTVAAATVRAVLAQPVPVVLDADALTLLADGAVAVPAERTAPLVLTPHDGEYARLAGRPPGDDRLAAARALAADRRAVVLLKGDRTIVAAPDGSTWVNPTGTALLASGGTGDVLTGLLGALLAAGAAADPADGAGTTAAARAAYVAAYLHGLAGRRAAGAGPVTASAVARQLRPPTAPPSAEPSAEPG